MSGNYSVSDRLELLKKINRIKIDDMPIYDFFIYKDISLWSFYQHSLWRDIEAFSGNQAFLKQPKKFHKLNFLFSLTAFIISLFSFIWFFLKKSEIIFLSGDKVTGEFNGDAKLEKIYKFLFKNNIYFAQFLHGVIVKAFFKNLFKRMRPAFFLTATDFLFFFIRPFLKKRFYLQDVEIGNYRDFTASEKNFIKRILNEYEKRFEVSVFRTDFFIRLLKILRPKIILMDDDALRTDEFKLAARILEIKIYSFQHGRFNKYLPGVINYGIPPEKVLVFDKYFVWNEFWKNKLINLSPAYRLNQNNVEIGGKPFFEKTADFIKTVPDDVITVLIPYETIAPKNEIREYIKAICACPKTRIIFKLRKDIGSDKQIEEAGLEEFKVNPKFTFETDLTPELLEKIDIVLGTYSTMLYEMVEAGKPIGIIKTSRSEAEDMVGDGLAWWIDIDSNDFCGDLEKIAKIDEEILRKNANFLKTTVNLEDKLKEIFNV